MVMRGMVMRAGFTLIELLVVMAIIAMLLSLALPRYFHSVQRSKETVLRHDLSAMRDAIDKYFADTGVYPAGLDDLVQKRYLRKLPPDPVTESSTTWVAVPPPDNGKGGVYDVKSGARGTALDGTTYSDW
jgi:general secretion pathway protein G